MLHLRIYIFFFLKKQQQQQQHSVLPFLNIAGAVQAQTGR